MSYLPALATLSAGFALMLAYGLFGWVSKVDEGTERMREIADYIRKSSMAFLKREFRAMAFVIVLITAAIGFFMDWGTAGLYAAGVLFSTLTGLFGIYAATKGNVKTINAATSGGIAEALKVAFRSGAVTGLCISGFVLFGLGAAVLLADAGIVQTNLIGFAFGASTVALFSRIGGGIFSKAASANIDLAGNQIVIIDSAGTGASGAAGMGSDLFESYAFALTAAIILAPEGTVFFPLMIYAIGIIASTVGIIFVRGGENTNPAAALNTGKYVSSIIMIIGSVLFGRLVFSDFNCAIAVVAGCVAGIAISKTTEIYTADNSRAVKRIAGHFQNGAASGIVVGFATGVKSAFWPVIFFAAAILTANTFADNYGIALAAVGMLSTVGMYAAVDAYAPVAANAAGIAEIPEFPREVKQIADILDAAGSTAGAAGKGYAAGAACFSAAAVFMAYLKITGLSQINLLDSIVILGLFIGAIIPPLVSSLVANSVERIAKRLLNEMKDTDPDFVKCTDASAKMAFRSVIAPGLISIIAPVLVGILLGVEALGGLLAGVVCSGLLTATIMSNLGGAWDNARRYIENGNFGGKRGKAYKSAAVGKAAGDLLKDASGPAVNVFVKLIIVISVVLSGVFINIGGLI